MLCSQTTPFRQTTIAQQMCSNAKGCSRQSPAVSERSHDSIWTSSWNKQLLPRTRIDIFQTSFSFSGSLAWNSLAHHLRYPMELKTFKRKAFQALAMPPWILRFTFFFFLLLLFFFFFFFFSFLLTRQTAWHEMYRMLLLFSLPCSCKVLDLCVCLCACVVFSWNIYLCFPPGHPPPPSNLMFAYMIVGVCDVLWFWLGVYNASSLSFQSC